MASNKYTELDKDSKWKEKYLASLDEIEKNEAQWKDSERILRALIVHLTEAADTSSEKLNKELAVLRDVIKKGVAPTKLKKAIAEIEDSISSLQAIRQKKQTQSAQQLRLLVDKIKPAGKIEKKLEKLSALLAKSRTAEDNLPMLNELAKLLVYGLSLADKKPEKGFFAARFKKDAEQPERKTEEKTSDETVQIASAEIQNVNLSGAVASLESLIDHMILPMDLQVEANLVKRQLSERPSEDIFIKSLEQTVVIVADVLARIKKEKKEIEEFLKQLTGRLHELDMDIRETARIRELTHQHGQKMTGVMKTEISSMEQGLSTINNLDELKTSIQSRVIMLRNHVDTFILEEAGKNREASSVIEELKNKVKNMEQETEKLKQEIEKEKQQTLRDALTEIPNRMAYEERLSLEMANYRRNQKKFVLVVWDIDFFKKVNDSYGHTAGDQVLKLVASILHRNMRETDFIARYGGEEFVSILPDTTLESAKMVTNKLREIVAESNFHFQDQPVKITLSAGFAEVTDNEEAEGLFSRADNALYQAKKNGRNNCQASN